MRHVGVVHHILLADVAGIAYRDQGLAQAVAFFDAVLQSSLRHKAYRSRRTCAAERTEHGPVMHRLRRGDGRIRVAHRRRDDHAAFDNQRGLGAEEGRLPQHDVRQFVDFKRADLVRNTLRDSGIYSVFRDITFHAKIVMTCVVLRQRAALRFHFVRGLPGARDHFADAAHRLRVGRDHAERAQVVQDVFRRDSLAADARFGERHVFGDARVQVVADHQHVEVFVNRVDRVRSRRISGRRQHETFAAHLDDIGGMSTSGTFGVIGMDGAAFECGNRVFDETGFIQRVSVDGDLHIVAVRDI